MENKPEKIFVDGLIAKKPREAAPAWVKCDLSIKREELLDWLAKQTGEWVNVQVCEARSGKWYAEVNTWKPKNES
jgi:hypothetical protein